MKTCAFHTLGCKVNQYETQGIRESFINAGYREVEFTEASDIYVVNTCTVTAKTDRDSRHLVRDAHRRNPHAKIVVTGCYAELDEDDIKGLPGVSLIVKNRHKARIVEIIDSKLPAGEKTDEPYQEFSISDFKNRTKAFLKVQDGCNNFCSYCKVPLVRGRSRSRDIKSSISEAERLISKGFKEIILTGICLGAWGEDLKAGMGLPDLIGRLINIEGDFRIRLSSIEPKYVASELIQLMKSSPKICRHLHIPLESGDDEILKMMNRPYSSNDYFDMVTKIRKAIPDIAITTDVLVGFPGEGERNFNNTYRLVKRINPPRVHIFPYSRREGTAASSMGDEPPREAVKKRMDKIKDLAGLASYGYRRKFLNKETSVLVENERDKKTGLLKGYDDRYIKVLLEGQDDLMSKIVKVRIKTVNRDETLAGIV